MTIDYITDRIETDALKLSRKYKPTKQTNNYMPLYDRHFNSCREKVRKVLEIGVQTERSIKMWKDYFPFAEIYGLDIDAKCKKFEEERVKILIGDQSQESVMNQLPDNLDIIIDDGSHVPKHQIDCFNYLFTKKMNSRGIYVVEDIGWRSQVINYFKNLSDHINFVPRTDIFKSENWSKLNSLSEYTDDWRVNTILGVSIYRFIVFIDKGQNPQDGQARSRIKL